MLGLLNEFHLFQAIPLIVDVFPSGMGLPNVVVKLPIHEHLVARRTTEILWLHVLLLDVASHLIEAADNSSADQTHEPIGQLLHLRPHH